MKFFTEAELPLIKLAVPPEVWRKLVDWEASMKLFHSSNWAFDVEWLGITTEDGPDDIASHKRGYETQYGRLVGVWRFTMLEEPHWGISYSNGVYSQMMFYLFKTREARDAVVASQDAFTNTDISFAPFHF